MKEIIFTDKEMNSLFLMVSYLTDSEQKNYMESMICYGEDHHNEDDLDHIYIHTKQIEQVLIKQTANL